MAPAPAAGAASRPFFTYALLAVLLAAFAAELLFPVGTAPFSFTPSIDTLLALGGLTRPLVLQWGEWNRLLTAVFLHAGPLHLLMNGLVLGYAGRFLERLVGHAWFGVVFVYGGLCGSVASLLLNPPGVVSVGASGALMALLSAGYCASFRLADAAERRRVQGQLARVLIPSLLPLAAAAGGQVDFAAHLGGTIGGGALGLLLLAAWPRSAVRPGRPRLAAALSILGVAACAFAATPLPRQLAHGYLSRGMIPEAALPKTDDAAKAAAADLVARYPEDPRAHFLRALAHADAGDRTAAEAELRTALARAAAHPTVVSGKFVGYLHYVLALLLADDGRRTEAEAELDAALKLDPGNTEATEARRDLLDK